MNFLKKKVKRKNVIAPQIDKIRIIKAILEKNDNNIITGKCFFLFLQTYSTSGVCLPDIKERKPDKHRQVATCKMVCEQQVR